MDSMNRHLARALGLVLVCAAMTAWAQDSLRVRARIERVEGQTLLVKSRDGAELKIVLTDNAVIVGLVKGSFADIKPGSFVGVTGLPRADGTLEAVEVHVLPESMRGNGEGHRPWDLKPQSTMTNGSVEHKVAGVEGQTMILKYKHGEKKFVVEPSTPIVTNLLGNKSELTPGTEIFIPAATKQPDGTLQAARVSFGKDGLTPPM